MEYEKFREQVIREMQKRFPELTIESQDVNKLQGQSYTGMTVRPEGSSVAASINLETYHQAFSSGKSLEAVLNRVEQDVAHVMNNMPDFDLVDLTDYGKMKDKLVIQLVPVSGNEDRLKDIPHRKVEDLAVVYRFDLGTNQEGSSSVLLNNAMLKDFGISEEQLHNDALEMAAQNRPATLRNMTDVMRGMMNEVPEGLFEEPSPIWVASVAETEHGACVLQYPGFLDHAAETLGGDFFILPSSVHEGASDRR